ncbi:MAG TPA: sigma-70 family RNA polymerase sigma factor [Acidobacteriota bacterium]|nr:sigma-70 family RNA polymerase sigma factor [Acidobacteriota bacterium]
MSANSPQYLTELLAHWGKGDQKALEELIPLVYDELRRLARHYLRNESNEHTLQTTALVHEVYLRLPRCPETQFQDRAHFFAVAAQLMRRILVDRARERLALKRGAGAVNLELDPALGLAKKEQVNVLALDDVLTALEKLDPQQCRIVELRFFGGLSIEETATALGISPATVKRSWAAAKAWLYRELRREIRS